MSIRTFIFCDRCNRDGVRLPDRRGRQYDRASDERGRRCTDDRSWLEESNRATINALGWSTLDSGEHICPRCQKNS